MPTVAVWCINWWEVEQVWTPSSTFLFIPTQVYLVWWAFPVLRPHHCRNKSQSHHLTTTRMEHLSTGSCTKNLSEKLHVSYNQLWSYTLIIICYNLLCVTTTHLSNNFPGVFLTLNCWTEIKILSGWCRSPTLTLNSVTSDGACYKSFSHNGENPQVWSPSLML